MHPVTPAGVLAGRDSESTLLDGLLRDLARGIGNAMLIEGEPGIGKTALARTALARAAQAAQQGLQVPAQVFWGAGDELGQELPLLPFLDALQVRAPSANARRTTIAGLLRGEVTTDRGADVPAMIAEQLIALIIEETASRPVVLVIDDVQWADQASVKLWGRLARTAREVPLLLVGLTRPTPAREELLAVRRAVSEENRLQLTPLTHTAVARLVGMLAGGRPDDGLLRLAAGAAGNPLYLTELIASLTRSGGIAVTAAGAAQLAADQAPNSLPAAIASRLDFVSPATRGVLRAAALLGVEFAVGDLTTVLGKNVAELVPSLDEAQVVGILADANGGLTLAFRHPLIREALYAELPVAVRSAWHRDAGHALAAAGAAPDRVARQLLRAVGPQASADSGGHPVLAAPHGGGAPVNGAPGGGPNGSVYRTDGAYRTEGPLWATGAPRTNGAAFSMPAGLSVDIERPPSVLSTSWAGRGAVDEWILDWLTTSADSLVGQAPGVAAELLTQAVDGIPAGSVKHGWLASRLADALYRTGDHGAAERVALRAIGHATDPDLIVDLQWTLAQCRILAGSAGDWLATLREALEAPGITAKHRGRLLVLGARSYMYFGDVEAAGREANRALASAGEAGDTWAIGWALHVLAIGANISGDLSGALPLYDRALAVTETDPALYDLGLLLQVNKAGVLFNLDRWEESLAIAERARRQADQVGTTVRLAQAHGMLSQVLYEMGRWEEALAEIALVPEDLKEHLIACSDLGIGAKINLHRNNLEAARRFIAAAEPHAERAGHRMIPIFALAQSLEREQVGDVPAAFAVLARVFDSNGEDLGDIEDLLSDGVRLAWKAREHATAQKLAGQVATLAAESTVAHRQANALYCRGLVDQDAGVLLAAAQRYQDVGRPLPRARALEAAAECLVGTDDKTAARQAFEQAVEVYEFLGAEADLNRVQSEFRAHGIRRGPHSKHRRAVSGWDSLTDTELKVAAFVEEGLSNPEIAARLMLSRRTVATHVSHILKKLDVATRTDIARESALRAVAAR
jgi:DNA-binding CsgD family transcriptional regulator/tetratricopeptide (TPR) repeat protein